MRVYPKPQPYSSEVLLMDDNGLLEPSFADAIAAIEKAIEVAPSRRTHWSCSLRQIAKALGRQSRASPPAGAR